MKGRPKDAEIQGYYCPLQRADLVEIRLLSGKCIRSDLGLEKHCPKCDQYWPMDTEFWYGSKTEDGLFSWCRSCYTKYRWPERGATPMNRPVPEIAAHLYGWGDLAGVQTSSQAGAVRGVPA